jgi:integrase
MASIQVVNARERRAWQQGDDPKDKRYRAFYRDAAGRNVGKVFLRRRDAEAHLRERAHEQVTGNLTDRRAGRQTFRELWEELHEWIWKHLPDLADRRIGDIGAGDVSRVLARIDKPVMREKARIAVSTMFNFAIAQRRVNVNPAKRTARSTTRAARKRERHTTAQEKVRQLNMDQLARLVAELPERYRALVRLMAYIGLRPGEAYALQVGKVDLVRRTVHVNTALSGETKSGEARTIPLPAVVVDMLRDHMAEFSDPEDSEALVFPTRDGTMIQNGPFRRLFQRASVRAGVNHGLVVNDLRHTAAAFAVANGANVYDVQRMLGHAKPSITLDVYGFLWDGSLERLAEKMDGAIRETWTDAPPEAEVVSFR